MQNPFYPLLFQPVYKNDIWGGTKIAERYRRPGAPQTCAESWEISDRAEGQSVVANGPLAGRTLHDLMTADAQGLVGSNTAYARFPLLVKIIDAHDRLSVQVHPDAARAPLAGGEPKTEMWLVLDAEPHACVFVGLAEGVSPSRFRASINGACLGALLNREPVREGDVFFIRGGTIHAIGAGCLLLEIQQNSNTTYRVYDWGRQEAAGHSRALHVEEALQTIAWTDSENPKIVPGPWQARGQNASQLLVDCPFFRVDRIRVRDTWTGRPRHTSCEILFAIAGVVDIQGGGQRVAAGPGTACLVPAALDAYAITARAGDALIARAVLP